MKKIFTASAIVIFALSNAQVSKGNWVISGNTSLGFNSSTTSVKSNGNKSDGPKVSTFTLSPSVGYFVIDGLSAGIDLGYNNTTTKQDIKMTSSTFSVMPTATYYFQTGSKFLPYLGAGIGYASNKTKYNYSNLNTNDIPDPLLLPDTEFKTSGLAWKVKGGITYMATSALGINFGLSYDQFSANNTNYNIDAKTKVNTFGVNLGFSYFLGMNKPAATTE